MNVQEFLDFISETGGLTNPPVNPFKKDWDKIKESIAPHFYGEVPSVLTEAFPNEDPEILKYRKSTYQAKTESPITKAINELSRLITGSKYSVFFDSENMSAWFNDSNFSGDRFDKYFFKSLVPYRVLDPNAVMLFWIPEVPKSKQVALQVEPQYISSDRIVFFDSEYPLLIFKGARRGKYKPLGYQTTANYIIVTDWFYGEVVLNDNTQKHELKIMYQHKMGFVPFFVLGGRAVPRYDDWGNHYTVYKSDFSAAIPYLADAAIFDNQHKSVMLACGFPHRFVPAQTCTSCNGMGQIFTDENPQGSLCGTCHGRKVTHAMSPLAGYYIAPQVNKISDLQQEKPQPLQFISPDVAILTKTAEEARHSLTKAENVLNINKGIQEAQSGTAKRLDKEGEYIEVGQIANDLFNKFQYALEIIQGLLFINESKSKISVQPPISFDLKNEVELLAEFAETQKGMPANLRYDAYLSYISQRYSGDDVSRKLAEVLVDYTSLVLFTIDERIKMLASGSITRSDNIRAAYAYDAIKSLYYSKKLPLDLTLPEYAKIIDAALQEKIDALQVAPAAEDVDTDNEIDPTL